MKAVLTLRNEMAELPRLLEFATDFAQGVGLPDQERSRLLIIIDELFSNVVLYGYDRHDRRGAIAVRLSCADGILQIQLDDDGRAFDPLKAPTPDLDLPAAERPVGGLGIYFVRKLVDEARYVRRGNRNRLVLKRRIAPSAPA